ncbi:hypothetical protein JZ751_024376 [Albula glossodonta]|uniref:Flavin-containing monooxygenase n=1 Tax=Albula glossodonta TaxID=121402 RepID=A0A8T2NI71_9TELE|nr:hypothetical protein JZ751_024376 [Albula glossodonta]
MSKRLRVAVVGAGAAGLCAARHVLALQHAFDPPVVYELTAQVGGTWVYEERVGCYDNGHPIHSSMYRNLRTNLPKEVMMFPDFPFDPLLPSFLPHQEVLRYLQSYSQHYGVTPHIRFETAVEEVKPVTMETGEGKVTWEVTSSGGRYGRRTETFDAVFICTGHYSDPYLPSIPGLEHFKDATHSIPVSGAVSLLEMALIGYHGRAVCKTALKETSAAAVVILSHGKPPLAFPLPPQVRQAPPVRQVLKDGGVEFGDGSVTHPQVLLLCTGYSFSYPFLSGASLGLQVEPHLVSPLYKQLLPPAWPSLFIIGICKIICPFPHFHTQVQFALAVLEGTVLLPSCAEMEAEVRREADRKLMEGVQPRHLLKMDSDQWGYYRTLASMGGFSPLPPVIQSLYEEVWRQRRRDPQKYRQINYRLVTDTQWEILELQPDRETNGERETER